MASFAALTVDFLGRSEFGAQARIPERRAPARPCATSTASTRWRSRSTSCTNDDNFKGRPLFVDIKRNDVLDLAVGGRFAIGERAMILANFLVPLNQDGLRSNFIPTISVETNF